jgi:hypothetical protein
LAIGIHLIIAPRFGNVFCYADAVLIHKAEVMHGGGIAQVRRLAVKPHGFGLVHRDAPAILKHKAKVKYGASVA